MGLTCFRSSGAVTLRNLYERIIHLSEIMIDPLRKKTLILLAVIVLVFFSLFYIGLQIPWSQMISPGPLCMSHQSIYRPGGCKSCHTEGKIVDNSKCMTCHTLIMDKIRQNAGLHARVPQECAFCHREHQGRFHNLIELDVETFDHKMTGWPLEGRHAILKCGACHTKGSYLLYKTECVDCHQDIHLGQLGTRCDQCHHKDGFEIEGYQHEESEKSPKAQHLNMACSECHRMEYAGYPAGEGLAIRYKGIDFSCTRCHEDVHDGENGTECLECHNQNNFEME